MSEISAESVRQEVRAWLEQNWDPDLSLLGWRNQLADTLNEIGINPDARPEDLSVDDYVELFKSFSPRNC